VWHVLADESLKHGAKLAPGSPRSASVCVLTWCGDRSDVSPKRCGDGPQGEAYLDSNQACLHSLSLAPADARVVEGSMRMQVVSGALGVKVPAHGLHATHQQPYTPTALDECYIET
jgi:hypothetical protein